MKTENKKTIQMKEVFQGNRVVGLAGCKSSGKTNNLMALIKEFRLVNLTTKIYVFGLNEDTTKWLNNFNEVYEVSSLDQLSDKEDSLIIIDEFQRLKLNDRRYRDALNNFVDFIYHKNNWVIFSSPNLKEFNSIICAKIEQWCLKSLRIKDLINGSQLKDVVLSYNGKYRSMDSIVINNNKLLIINNDYEKVIELEYITQIDSKKKRINIFN